MSLFGDSQFFAAAGVLAAVAVIMGLREVNIRHYGFAVSIFFTFMAMKDSPAALIVVRRVPGDPVHHRQGVS